MRDKTTPLPLRPTLQDVLDGLTDMFAANEIDAVTLRDTRSAVVRYCTARKKEPRQVAANIAEMFEGLDASWALRAGMDAAPWSNMKSLLRKALRLVGNPAPPARRDKPHSSRWSVLLAACGDRDVQTRLSPFAGYCTDHGIEPDKVRETTLQDYALYARETGKSDNPQDAMMKVRRCWNKLVDQNPDTLSFRTTVHIHKPGWGLNVTVTPQSFQDELDKFAEARSPATYEDHFKCKPLKTDEAVGIACQMIMRIVTAFIKIGHAPEKITSFAYLVEPARAPELMRALKAQTGATELNQLQGYASLLRWLATIWVELPKKKLEKLNRYLAVVGTRPKQLSESTLEVLTQLERANIRKDVKDLADVVYAEFKAKGPSATYDDAMNFRDALYWELGLHAGWRPGTRSCMQHNEHVFWQGRKGVGHATVVAPRKGEKRDRGRRADLPLSVSKMLWHFITHARPLLRTQGDDANSFLFPGRFGGHINSAHLSQHSATLIAKRTKFVGATGHKSRHTAAFLHLLEHPEDYDTVAAHLGHDVETTKRYYIEVTQKAASNRVQTSLGKR